MTTLKEATVVFGFVALLVVMFVGIAKPQDCVQAKYEVENGHYVFAGCV